MSADKCKHGVELATICNDCDDEAAESGSTHSLQRPCCAAGPKTGQIWPLLMALSFIVMTDQKEVSGFAMQAVTVAALTYSISHRLCRRRHNGGTDRPLI